MGGNEMIGAMIFANAMPLLQGVSPELQQAIQDEVQEELRRGRFRFGPGRGGVGFPGMIPTSIFAIISLNVFFMWPPRHEQLWAPAEFSHPIPYPFLHTPIPPSYLT